MTAGANCALLPSFRTPTITKVKTYVSHAIGRAPVWAVFGFFFTAVNVLFAADFAITSPGFFYATNGQGMDPTITLVRGRTYTFALNTAPSHPFFIGTSVGSGVAPPGVSGQSANGNSSGTITFNVPTNAVNCVYYCTVHFFAGSIVMVDPPTPPVPRIVGFSFGTNIVLRSSPATNTFSIIPEFKTDLNNTSWAALTVLSNRFSNGTNETFCGRPPGTNVFIRVRVQ
jgi:hypothetical protein